MTFKNKTIKKLQKKKAPSPVIGMCEDDIIDFVVSDTIMSWFDANMYCISNYGTSLITIDNEKMNDYAFKLCKAQNNGNCWIGYYNDKCGNQTFYDYKWIANTQQINNDSNHSLFKNWHFEEPNLSGCCVLMLSEDGTWNDANCQRLKHAICGICGIKLTNTTMQPQTTTLPPVTVTPTTRNPTTNMPTVTLKPTLVPTMDLTMAPTKIPSYNMCLYVLCEDLCVCDLCEFVIFLCVLCLDYAWK